MRESAKKPNKDEKGRSGVLICGAYGHGNAGDDAILEAMVGEMRAIDPDMAITVLSRRPEETRALLGVDSVHTFNLFGFLRVMRGTRLYISGGGSLIQDVTSRRSLWYYLFSIAAAKLAGNRVMMYGCGIGPVRRSYNRRIAGKIIDKYVDVITLREDDSLDELRRYGVARPEMILSSDPALSLPPAPPEEIDAEMERRGLDPRGNYICFALRRWPGYDKSAAQFAAAADHACEKHGLTPVFISINHRNDGDASDAAAALMRSPRVILREPMLTGLTIGIISRMRAVVSMRLHGLIFAAGQGVPCVGVAYDPKVSAFMRYIRQDLCVDFEGLDARELISMVDRAVSERSREELLANAKKLAGIENRNVETAKRLLDTKTEGNTGSTKKRI